MGVVETTRGVLPVLPRGHFEVGPRYEVAVCYGTFMSLHESA